MIESAHSIDEFNSFCFRSTSRLELSPVEPVKMPPIKNSSHNLEACEAALAKLPKAIEIKRVKQSTGSIETIQQMLPVSVVLQNINPINATPQTSTKSIVTRRLSSTTVQDKTNDNSEQQKTLRRKSAMGPSNENDRRQPQSNQQPKSNRQHKCGLCNKTYANPYLLSVHKSTHQDEKPIECGFCQKTFHNNIQLRNHERRTHKNQSIGCTFCDKTFSKSFDNIAHIRTEHFNLLRKQDKLAGNLNALFQGIRTYECFKCGYSADSYNLKIHMAQCQPQFKFYECSFCMKKFNRRYNLRKHENIHKRTQNDTTKMTVKVVGQASITKNERRTQKRSIRVVEETKPLDLSKQPADDAKSDVPSALQNKQKLASKGFQCDKCSKKLRNRNELRAHQRVHDKVIECGQCNFKCHLNIALSKHMRTMHALGSNVDAIIELSDGDDEEVEG